MCGKFTQPLSWGEAVTPDEHRAGTEGGSETVTPMRFATVIALDGEGRRRAVRMRWGLVPPGARDVRNTKPHIHARAESIDEKPTFREAFRHRRGLVVCSTFNEGREITPTKTEQYVLTPKDDEPVAIAVVWERWSGQDGASLLSFAMVTVPPNALIGSITERMPALIEPADWPAWLGETSASLDEIKALLRTSERPLDMQKAVKPGAKRDQPSFL